MAMSQDRTTAAVVHQAEVLLVPLEPLSASGLQTFDSGGYFPRLGVHPQLRWLATRTDTASVLHLWKLSDASGGLIEYTIPSSTYFAFSPDGQWLATCWSREFQFYRVGAWREPAFVIPRLFGSDLHAPLAFARDGRTVALAASRYLIQLHKLPQSGRGGAQLIATLESPDRLPLEILAFSPDSLHLAAATDGQIVLLWNLAALGEGLARLDLRRDWPGAP